MAILDESNFSGKNGTHFKLTLEYTYTQSQTGNYTSITYTLKFTSMDGYSASGTANGVKGYINGSQVGTATSIGVNTTLTLGTQNVTIYHNPDGTFPTTSYGASIQTVWTLGSASVSGTLSGIPQIDRYPELINAPNFNDEQNPTITYTTNLGFSGATVKACIANATGSVIYVSYRDVVVANGSYTFNLTEEERNALRNAIPNSNTLSVSFYLTTTYNGQVFASYLIRTLTIVNGNPTFDVAYEDTNTTTTTITNDNQQIIQNNSTLQLNVTNATALKGATLTSIETNINGVITTTPISSSTLNIDIGTINVATNINALLTLKDSRNNSTTITLPIEVLGWELPTAIITLNRKSNYYTETDIKVDANYSSLDNKNTISIKYRIKKTTDANYGSYNTLSDNVTSTFNADNQYEWNVQVLIEDKIGSTTYNLSLAVGTPIMFVDRSKRNVGIECFPQSTNAFEVKGSTQINGSLTLCNSNGNNPIDLSNTYSSTEQIVGFWVDGKPLYRKYVPFTTPSTETDYSVPHNITNISQIVRIWGGFIDNYFPIPCAIWFSTTYYYTSLRATSTGIVYYRGSSAYGNTSAYMIIEYTKTS